MPRQTGSPPGQEGFILSLRGVSKYFPGVIANKDVDLDILPGEIHALLGENGAGKSTLMNIVTGIYQTDAGTMSVRGSPVDFTSPADAIRAGIGMVHQHFKLVRAFTVAENIHLGWDETPPFASAADLAARTRAIAQQFNLKVDPNARVASLSAGEQQRVEILRVLARGARLLILDEPTAVLTPGEARELFVALDAFRKAGNAVIFISHKLNEVMEICDRVTVLRGGRKVALRTIAECSSHSLAGLMVGRELSERGMRGVVSQPQAAAKPVVTLKNVSIAGPGNIPALAGVDLDIRGGEILGIAGVAGNGQSALGQVISGMLSADSGQVLLEGKPVCGGDAHMFADFGIGHIPEDRLKSGLAPSLSITDNMALREYKSPAFGRPPFYSSDAAAKLALEIASAAEVAIPNYQMPVRNLSGGNQQRLVASREMRIASKILVAAYPSRGLDIGAISDMHRYMTDLRNRGVAVVLFSEDLEELLHLSDRIAVLYEGRIMGIVDGRAADIETIGLMMGGKAAA
jgi:ABC-type uncharacterized transport system ATPase subunit